MIKLKNKFEIQKMKDSGKILSQIFAELNEFVYTGISAFEIDQWVYNKIKSHNAVPSFLGYSGFEFSSCISKNEEVVHGIPHKSKIFEDGDFCSVDIGVYFNGYHADAARIFKFGTLASNALKLLDVTEACFWECIKFAYPGNKLGDIQFALQNYAETRGFSVVKDLCSHGIGESLHEDPLIPNFGKKGKGITLKEGMTFAIEPMINEGSEDVLTLSDKWTIITADQKLSGHYENTILITDDGPEILTIC